MIYVLKNSKYSSTESPVDMEKYKRWKSLINMSAKELQSFMDSEEGKVAGLPKDVADKKGIKSGRESASWIIRMLETNVKDWTPEMWRWCSRQISFISRMKGNPGPLRNPKGERTRKTTSLLIWGHNPEK